MHEVCRPPRDTCFLRALTKKTRVKAPLFDVIHVEHSTYLWSGSALKLGFDGPWHIGSTILTQHDVRAQSVDVLRIDQEAVHIKETSTDGRESRAYTLRNARSTGAGDGWLWRGG